MDVVSSIDGQAGRDIPADPALTGSQAEADVDDLRHGLAGLAGLTGDAQTQQDLLAQVAAFAAQSIPGAQLAGIAMLRAEPEVKLQICAAADELMDTLDDIQYRIVGEGPCLTCMNTGRPVISGALGSDVRWPRFGGRAARLGVHSALSVPLLMPDRVVGAINAYARERDAFTEHAVRYATQFAGPAAVAVYNAQLLTEARTKTAELQNALTSRAIIDQAIGVIRSRSGGAEEEAFARLRQISQADNVKIAEVARRLVDEAVRGARARHKDS